MSMDKALRRQNREELLLTGNIPHLFVKYALPGVAGLLFLGLQSVVDGIVLGHFVGANALASVNLILPCYSLITAIAIVIGVGCQTIVSISLGRSNRQEANDAVASLFYFLIGFSVLISLLIYLFAEPIAVFLGANAVLLNGSVGYIRTLVPFFPILCAMFFGDYILKAMGKPVYATTIMGATVLINILLDLLFVGIWNWGIEGAGLATGFAFSVGAFCNVPSLFSRKQIVSVQRGRFRSSLVWNAFYNGSSEGMSELAVAITVFLFNITMMRYLGEDGVAAFTVINYVSFIATTLYLGVSDGIIPVIGYNFGAGYETRIRAILKLAARTNMLIGSVLFIALFGFGEQIISLFFKERNNAAFDIALEGVVIYSFAFLINGLNILASSYFTAIGNAKVSIIISMLRGLVFVVFGILVYPRVWGIQSIWFNVPVAEICTLFISGYLVWKSFKKEVNVRVI